MTRRPTYGENMRSCEREQDEANWTSSFYLAVANKNYKLVEELVIDAIDEQFFIPIVDDEKVNQIVSNLSI